MSHRTKARTNATVNLSVNGQRAVKRLQQLRQQAMNLSEAISKAAVAGDKVELKRLRKELTARPLINALDYAQRTNTIGSLRPSDVSRSITAPQVIAANTGNDAAMVTMAAAMGSYSETMRRPNQRLNEPFVTVNTVTGDTGIKRAQDEYEQLMRNKTPKSRRMS